MTKLLEAAIDKACGLPAERQDDAARILLAIVEQNDASAGGGPLLTPRQIAGVQEAIAEADTGDLVGKAEIDEVFAKHQG